MLPAAASFHAGASLPSPSSFLLSSYAQKRHIEYDIWRSHVPEIPSKSPRTPAREWRQSGNARSRVRTAKRDKRVRMRTTDGTAEPYPGRVVAGATRWRQLGGGVGYSRKVTRRNTHPQSAQSSLYSLSCVCRRMPAGAPSSDLMGCADKL